MNDGPRESKQSSRGVDWSNKRKATPDQKNSYSSTSIRWTKVTAALIYHCIHSEYVYSASSSPLLRRGAPFYHVYTVSELTCRSAIQATVSEKFAKVPTWRLEWDSNLRPYGRKAANLSMSHHATRNLY